METSVTKLAIINNMQVHGSSVYDGGMTKYGFVCSEQVEVDAEPDESIPIVIHSTPSSSVESMKDSYSEEIIEVATKIAIERCQQTKQIQHPEYVLPAQHHPVPDAYPYQAPGNQAYTYPTQFQNNCHIANNPMCEDSVPLNSVDTASSYSFETVSYVDDDERMDSTKDEECSKNPGKSNKSSVNTASTRQCVLRGTSFKKKKSFKVFITYAATGDDKENAQTVLQVAQTFCRNHIEVKVDFMEQNVQAMSISEWIDVQLTECAFVVICISSHYPQVVREEANFESLNFKERALHTTYIYRRIHAEYINNHSKNYRFIPILINDGKLEHVPEWLRDTRLYKWPEEYEAIIYRLFRIEKYVKPKLGAPPKPTLERYDK